MAISSGPKVGMVKTWLAKSTRAKPIPTPTRAVSRGQAHGHDRAEGDQHDHDGGQ